METAILLDADHTRRLVKRKIDHHPSPVELEQFCLLCCRGLERIEEAYYYDCPPFGEIRPMPVSGIDRDFSGTAVFQKATEFQKEMGKSKFFTFRKGVLSFDGWTLSESCIADLIAKHRPLTDGDFTPVIRQKQVDMKIGLDIAKIALKGRIKRLLLVTADADFIPAIHFARSKNLEVVLITDDHSSVKIKNILTAACSEVRIV